MALIVLIYGKKQQQQLLKEALWDSRCRHVPRMPAVHLQVLG